MLSSHDPSVDQVQHFETFDANFSSQKPEAKLKKKPAERMKDTGVYSAVYSGSIHFLI